jgi:AcrR family transcriptional regulator
MSSRERGRETRARILSATAELIAEDGWSGFSTRDVAARAGVTQGIVSYHWRSKDELLREAALSATTEMFAPIGAALGRAASAHSALEQMLALAGTIRDSPQMTLLLFETMLQAARDPQVRDALAVLIREFRDQLAAALARDGVPDPSATAAALAAALDGLFLHAVVDDQLDLHAAGSALLHVTVSGREATRGSSRAASRARG